MKISFFLLGAATLCANLAVSPRANALPRLQNCATRHSVLDYYRLLPGDVYFEQGHRKAYLNKKTYPAAVVDLRRDYLRSGSERNGQEQPVIELAVFRYRGAELLGVASHYRLGHVLSFYRLQQGRLLEVTRQVLPDYLHVDQRADLPRYGTTIRVVSDDTKGNDVGRYLYSWVWRNGRLVKTR